MCHMLEGIERGDCRNDAQKTGVNIGVVGRMVFHLGVGAIGSAFELHCAAVFTKHLYVLYIAVKEVLYLIFLQFFSFVASSLEFDFHHGGQKFLTQLKGNVRGLDSQ